MGGKKDQGLFLEESRKSRSHPPDKKYDLPTTKNHPRQEIKPVKSYRVFLEIS